MVCEWQASNETSFVQAAAMINAQPIALQLRLLQTMRQISSEHNPTTSFPSRSIFFTPFIKRSVEELAKK